METWYGGKTTKEKIQIGFLAVIFIAGGFALLKDLVEHPDHSEVMPRTESTENIKAMIQTTFTEFQGKQWKKIHDGWQITSKDPFVSVQISGGKLEMHAMGAGMSTMIQAITRCVTLGRSGYRFNANQEMMFARFVDDFIGGKNPNTFTQDGRTFSISNKDVGSGDFIVNNFACGFGLM